MRSGSKLIWVGVGKIRLDYSVHPPSAEKARQDVDGLVYLAVHSYLLLYSLDFFSFS